MKRVVCCAIATVLLFPVHAAEQTINSEAMGYTLSMAGALINDHCQRQWQDSGYISIHACNYQLAQQYNLEISTTHFEQCTVLSRGDIVQIADCMVEQFNVWSSQALTKER